jgi:hypothetical protein
VLSAKVESPNTASNSRNASKRNESGSKSKDS